MFAGPVVISSVSFLILIVCVVSLSFFPFFFVNLAGGLSISLTFFQSANSVSLIFTILFSILFIFALVFIISFLLFTLGLFCSFSRFFG